MSDAPNISRRKLFESIFQPLKRMANAAGEVKDALANSPEVVTDRVESSTEDEQEKVAIIQGRFCLAYQRSFCTTCSERCPEEGAIVVEKGIPRVVGDLCTGCGICHDVCPAPKNAILVMNKLPKKNYVR